MPDPVERRTAPRVALIGRPGARTYDGVPVFLANLSTTGAGLTYFKPFPPGTALTLQFPPGLDGLRLAIRVVWTKVHGSEQTVDGEHHPMYQSGVAFREVTPEQQATLERLVERFRQERASSTG